MKITIPVAKSNILTANGNIYPSEVLLKMAEELNKKYTDNVKEGDEELCQSETISVKE